MQNSKSGDEYIYKYCLCTLKDVTFKVMKQKCITDALSTDNQPFVANTPTLIWINLQAAKSIYQRLNSDKTDSCVLLTIVHILIWLQTYDISTPVHLRRYLIYWKRCPYKYR